MDAAGVDLSEGWFQMMRLIKKVGGHIIEFLAQIEEFQKMLWEKRKFVTETFYCITMSNIPAEFYPEIAACDAQWEEWKTLLRIDEEEANLFTTGKGKKDQRMEFLKTHQTLVLDTRHFTPDPSTGSGQSFTDRLLASFDDLEEATDGLLVNSENWQALNLLAEKYKGQVACEYIDPPYNTAASEILYKNDYKHSSWLSLIINRVERAHSILSNNGILSIAIDDAEYHHLYQALLTSLGHDLVLGTVIVRSNPAGRSALSGFSVSHDYAIFYGATPSATVGEIEKTDAQISRYSEKDKNGQFEWVNFRKHGGLNANRVARPKLFYPIYATQDGHVMIPTLEWDVVNNVWTTKDRLKDGESIVWPVNEKGEEKTWKWGHATALQDLTELTARPDRSESLGIYMKSRMREGSLPPTLWTDKKYSATDYGTNLLAHIMGASNLFSFPKSIYTVMECIRVCNISDDQYCLDFFAGSGTSSHAVINLNREDGGQRKFILVEMAHYFDTVLLPRIKKVTFAPEWKDGKPKRMATAEEAERSPRIVKVIRLESYEDALNNIAFDDPSGQQAMQFEDYLLQYMLKWETRHSETLLNVEKLDKPFSYQLHIHRDGETRTQAVDLPETFVYLLGLNVRKRQVISDSDRRYLVYHGDTREGRKVAVIWRAAEGWKEKDYTRDKIFVAAQKLTEGVDDVYVNGDSYIPGARALEPLFKARMFADVEA